MQLEVVSTRQDHLRFIRYLHFGTSWKRKSIIVILLSLFFSFPRRGVHFDMHIYSLHLLVLFVCLLVAVFIIPYLSSLLAFKRVFNSVHDNKLNQVYTIKQDGLEIQTGDELKIHRWDSLRGIYKTPEFVWFRMYMGRYCLVPLAAFTPETAATNFVDEAATKIALARGNKSSGRHLYGFGFLGLIPLIGFFAGIVLFFKGIVQYKNKYLALIGGVATLPSILVYGFLIYQVEFGDMFKEGMTKLSQSSLNSLVKNVEFYKMQKGMYPDSLQQLRGDDSLLIVYDPLQIKIGKSGLYNYRRIGDKYTLFSSGKDGIAGTADDLYPTVQIADSSKIGLIRK